MEEFYQEEGNNPDQSGTDGLNILEEMEQEQFGGLDIIHLFGKEKLEDIQRMISKATGLAFVTVDYKGEPITEPTSFTKFCHRIRSNENIAMRCKASDAFGAIQAAVTQKPSVYFCPCGLIEVAIPIALKGHYLGGFIGGQIRCDDAPEEVSQLKKVMPSPALTLPKEEQEALFGEIPVFSYTKFQDIANLVFLIINQLTENEAGRYMQEELFRKKIRKIYASNQKQAQDLKSAQENIAQLTVQTDPYFMLDILASLVNLSIIEKAERTSELLLGFSDFLRYTYLERGIFARVSKEIEQAERYLFMQKQKYGERLSYSIQIPPGMSMHKIPAGVLFPFVERAVFFGTTQNPLGGTVSISGLCMNGQVTVEIEDNGPGYSDEELEQRFEAFGEDFEGHYIRIGIDGARQIMKKLFHGGFELTTECRAGEGSKSRIVWPEHFNERVDF